MQSFKKAKSIVGPKRKIKLLNLGLFQDDDNNSNQSSISSKSSASVKSEGKLSFSKGIRKMMAKEAKFNKIKVQEILA